MREDMHEKLFQAEKNDSLRTLKISPRGTKVRAVVEKYPLNQRCIVRLCPGENNDGVAEPIA